jgi:putative salt-induced outer membrane protein
MDQASFFLIGTGRHDKFQGLDFRLNIDPGYKYLFLKAQTNSLWGEAGYDFQYDIRRDDALAVIDANKNPVLDANGNQVMLSKTATDHSARLFVGFRHAFNKEVTLASGVEYLQSFIDTTRYRVNVDALFAAKVGGGLSVGIGFSGRYDHDPLPGKQDLDTATTLSLVYSFSDIPEPPKPACAPAP